MEQSKGHLFNNLLPILQLEGNMSLQNAVDSVGIRYRELYLEFQASGLLLPSFGEELDKAVSSVFQLLSIVVPVR